MKVGKFGRLVDRVPNTGYLLDLPVLRRLSVNERVGQKIGFPPKITSLSISSSTIFWRVPIRLRGILRGEIVDRFTDSSELLVDEKSCDLDFFGKMAAG